MLSNPIATPVSKVPGAIRTWFNVLDKNGCTIVHNCAEREADSFCLAINNFDDCVEALRLATNVIESRGKLLNITPDIILGELRAVLDRIDAEMKGS